MANKMKEMERRVSESTENLIEFLKQNPKMISMQNEIEEVLESIGDDPIMRLHFLEGKMKSNLAELAKLTKEIEDALDS